MVGTPVLTKLGAGAARMGKGRMELFEREKDQG